MLFIVQLPFADSRPFIAGQAEHLALPNWPPGTARTANHPELLKSFGEARSRLRGADLAFTDEPSYFRADHALRFPKPHMSAKALGWGDEVRPHCMFRRLLLSDESRAAGRVEVGIYLPFKKSTPISFASLISTAASILSLPSEVPSLGGERVHKPLVSQGSALAALYARATTRGEIRNEESKLVIPGLASIFIQSDPTDPDMQWLEGTTLTRVDKEKVRGFDVFFGWLDVKKRGIPMWILDSRDQRWALARSLRLCLLRLHAEQAALNEILNSFQNSNIHFEPGAEESEAFQAYLNRATRLINRRHWQGFDQSSILEAFDAGLSTEPPEMAGFRARFEGVRQQVFKKVEVFEARWAASRTTNIYKGDYTVIENNSGTVQTVKAGGDIVGAKIAAGENITITTHLENILSRSAAPPAPELAKFLRELEMQIQGVLQETRPELRGATADDFDNFAKEAVKKEPDKQLLEGWGDKLINAAKKVQDFAEPVLKTVSTIWTFLKVVAIAA